MRVPFAILLLSLNLDISKTILLLDTEQIILLLSLVLDNGRKTLNISANSGSFFHKSAL